MGPKQALTTFTFFLVRGIEGAMAKTGDVALDWSALEVSWRLSVSKTDPAALGCERKWGCTCVSTPGVGCPFHAAAAQMALLCDRFPEKVENGDAYLFPDASGEMVTNAAMEAFVDALASMAGQGLTLPSGVRRFG